MSNGNLVSVIMSVYNEKPEWLKSCIDSILQQTYRNLEFIIILDKPENSILKALLLEYQQTDSRVKVSINEENKGLIFSLNKALMLCNGDYIARMDADDIAKPHRLATQIAFLNTQKLDLVGANVELFNDEQGTFHYTDKLQTHAFLKKMLEVGTIGIVHPTFFAKANVYEQLGGYRQSLHTEDKEFLARVFVNGFKVGNVADCLLSYRYSETSITKSNSFYVFKMGKYVTDVFKTYLKTGEYKFDYNYIERVKASDEELTAFNKKQVILGEARSAIHNKNYIKALKHLIHCIYLSKSTLLTLKINVWLKCLRAIEKRRALK